MRPVPAEPLLALLRHFDPSCPDPPAAMAAGAATLLAAVGQRAIDDLNDGQYAALVDLAVTLGADFAATAIAGFVTGGNLTLPVYEFQNYGERGLAELDLWLMGTLY